MFYVIFCVAYSVVNCFNVSFSGLIISVGGESACFPVIMSPPVRVGRHIVFPLASVCLCVCLSVTKSCPRYNLITVTDISTKLHTFVKHIETTCHAQEP